MSDYQIIYLNGPSSAGKSSLSKALQNQLVPDIYLRYSSDEFFDMLPPNMATFIDQYYKIPCSLGKKSIDQEHAKHFLANEDLIEDMIRNIYRGMKHSIKKMISCDNKLIIDHSVSKRGLKEFTKPFKDLKMLLVGVHCSPEELERRELERSDRAIGRAKYQYKKTREIDFYDFEVDTTETSPEDCAKQIVEFIRSKE